jgi:hypothetical protein
VVSQTRMSLLSMVSIEPPSFGFELKKLKDGIRAEFKDNKRRRDKNEWNQGRDNPQIKGEATTEFCRLKPVGGPLPLLVGLEEGCIFDK